ncbi:citrulline utilization hydrolase CtlX [Naumannella halotolerans]|uniref:Amidinotransferase n=1 Tax=Naumannella halotolerans TaxID=993414 RepID=A0A4V3EMQ0_9ACTN|nr:arginine deiminase-related protein [Naumannella halotolerans]TDT30858.1 hypothetical protein CLV29_2264 [Naumannella halotolerans]
MQRQAPGAVIMIRPHHFRPNPQTRADNAFQSPTDRSPRAVAATAFAEVTAAAERLRGAGVEVHLFDDHDHGRPDSVFCNNWLSTHADGQVGLFPMYAPNRRSEHRSDVLEFLRTHYRVGRVTDYSPLQAEEVFLESTGAMVLDHEFRTAYTARSHRADPYLLERFCTDFGYRPVIFDALDGAGVPIYHTNVMMAIGTEFALIGLDAIADPARRTEVALGLSADGRREIVELSIEQLQQFAGNALELSAGSHRILAMSTTALAALTADQRRVIEKSAEIVALSVPTIELAGGSVRCMLAGVHLPPRDDPRAPTSADQHQVDHGSVDGGPVDHHHDRECADS